MKDTDYSSEEKELHGKDDSDLIPPTAPLLDDASTEKAKEAESISFPGHQRVENGSLGASKTSLKSNGSKKGGQVVLMDDDAAKYQEALKGDLKQGLTRNLVLMSLFILIGDSMLYGYNIGVLNQPTGLIQQFYNDTHTSKHGDISEYTLTFLWSLTTALYLPGGMIGAFSVGILADKLGRKRTVMLSCVPSIVGGVLSTACVAASSPELLMVGRFIVGLSCGMATSIAPMYLMEICPFNLRGAFGTAAQLFSAIGLFIGSVLGLREILGTEQLWPYLMLVNVCSGLLCLCLMPFFPDSPRYLMLIRGDREAAREALRFIRQKEDVEADIREMEAEYEQQQQAAVDSSDTEEDSSSYTIMRLLRTRELRVPLIVAVSLQSIQQLSGINAIFFYSTSIFLNAGVPSAATQYAVMGTCAVNVIMTIVAVPVMDRAGRRPLLLYPMIGMIVILAVIVVALKLQSTLYWMSYVSIACVISYVISFAVGLGPIPAMLGTELFRQGPRSKAMSLGSLANWLAALFIAISFEFIQKLLKEYTFLVFFVLMIFFTIFVYFQVPETKNKTFEEIASSFQKDSKKKVNNQDELANQPLKA